jgi:hypothetical protein
MNHPQHNPQDDRTPVEIPAREQPGAGPDSDSDYSDHENSSDNGVHEPVAQDHNDIMTDGGSDDGSPEPRHRSTSPIRQAIIILADGTRLRTTSNSIDALIRGGYRNSHAQARAVLLRSCLRQLSHSDLGANDTIDQMVQDFVNSTNHNPTIADEIYLLQLLQQAGGLRR